MRILRERVRLWWARLGLRMARQAGYQYLLVEQENMYLSAAQHLMRGCREAEAAGAHEYAAGLLVAVGIITAVHQDRMALQ